MTKTEALRRLLARLPRYLLALTLAACGGGGFQLGGGVGTGGTGIGTITGFGSLIVDGNLYSSATAEYWQGDDANETLRASALSVALGQQVQMLTDSLGNPTAVYVEPTLIGAAAEVSSGTGTLKVNGIRVRTSTDPALAPATYYAGLAGLGEVVDGMKIEVHGLYGSDSGGPYVLATRIAQLPSATVATRITGEVSDLTSDSFRIGGMTIRFGTATSRLPAGAALADGQLVNVWSSASPSGGQLAAEVIRVRGLYGIAGRVAVAGLIDGLAGNRFRVSGIDVDAADARLAGTVAALRRGDYVVVGGQAGAGRLVADSLRVGPAGTGDVELKGSVTEYVDTAHFKVRGVAIDAGSATISGGTLANGAYVEVHGRVRDNTVAAATVEVKTSTPTDATVEYEGSVSARSGNGFILTLTGGTTYTVTLADNVGYENGSASQLVNGARIEVEATRTAAGLTAYAIEFKSSTAPVGSVYETSGIAYNVTATRFWVNDLSIEINGKDATGLANGVKVEVHFTASGGLYYAQEIDVED